MANGYLLQLNFNSSKAQRLRVSCPVQQSSGGHIISIEKRIKLCGHHTRRFRSVVALLKAQVPLQFRKVFSSDNRVSVSIMYLYMYWLLKKQTAKILESLPSCFEILNAYLMTAKYFCTYSEHIIHIWALGKASSVAESAYRIASSCII